MPLVTEAQLGGCGVAWGKSSRSLPCAEGEGHFRHCQEMASDPAGVPVSLTRAGHLQEGLISSPTPAKPPPCLPEQGKIWPCNLHRPEREEEILVGLGSLREFVGRGCGSADLQLPGKAWGLPVSPWGSQVRQPALRLTHYAPVTP